MNNSIITLRISDVRIGASKLTPGLKRLTAILSVVAGVCMFFYVFAQFTAFSNGPRVIFSLIEAALAFLGGYLILMMLFGWIRSLFLTSKRQYLKELDVRNNESIAVISFVIMQDDSEKGLQFVADKADELKKNYPAVFDCQINEPRGIKGGLVATYFSTLSELLEMSEKIGVKPDRETIAQELFEGMKNIEADIECDADRLCDFSDLYQKLQRLRIDLAKQLLQRKLLVQQILDFKLS